MFLMLNDTLNIYIFFSKLSNFNQFYRYFYTFFGLGGFITLKKNIFKFDDISKIFSQVLSSGFTFLIAFHFGPFYACRKMLKNDNSNNITAIIMRQKNKDIWFR